MIIRWLGAYGRGPSLLKSLEWEMKDRSHKCAERVYKGKGPQVEHPLVGLLVKGSAVVRRWSGDVYSTPRRHGGVTLRRTRDEKSAVYHNEYWVRPRYSAVVIKSRGCSGRTISQKALLDIYTFCESHKLPVYRINKDGSLKEVVLMRK